MNNNVTVIIPTNGDKSLENAISSVCNQTYSVTCFIVCDGLEYAENVHEIINKFSLGYNKIKLCVIPENVGANGYYGHRIYAAFTHLVNSDYVMYLDQDNQFEDNHVKSCLDLMKSNNLDWVYSLRNIYSNGNFVCEDNCESLGKWESFQNYKLTDTNCYCIKTSIASQVASAWHGGFGQDRIFYNTLSQYFPKFDCTGLYSVNYKTCLNPNFFLSGNEIMTSKFNGEFPWKKTL